MSEDNHYDPQHQAVIDAAAELREARYSVREQSAEYEYLGDFEDLVREVVFLLTRAGVSWADLQMAGHPDNQSPLEQRIFSMTQSGQLEYVLMTALERKRQEYA